MEYFASSISEQTTENDVKDSSIFVLQEKWLFYALLLKRMRILALVTLLITVVQCSATEELVVINFKEPKGTRWKWLLSVGKGVAISPFYDRTYTIQSASVLHGSPDIECRLVSSPPTLYESGQVPADGTHEDYLSRPFRLALPLEETRLYVVGVICERISNDAIVGQGKVGIRFLA